jgi:hypothetical protein
VRGLKAPPGAARLNIRGQTVTIHDGPANAKADAEHARAARARNAEISRKAAEARPDQFAGLVSPPETEWLTCAEAADLLGLPVSESLRGLADRRFIGYRGPQAYQSGSVVRHGRFARPDVERLAAILVIEGAHGTTEADWIDATKLFPSRDPQSLAGTMARIATLGVRTRERVVGFSVATAVNAWDAYRLAGNENPTTSRAAIYRQWMREARNTARAAEAVNKTKSKGRGTR